jgi:hypothetical protein
VGLSAEKEISRRGAEEEKSKVWIAAGVTFAGKEEEKFLQRVYCCIYAAGQKCLPRLENFMFISMNNLSAPNSNHFSSSAPLRENSSRINSLRGTNVFRFKFPVYRSQCLYTSLLSQVI